MKRRRINLRIAQSTYANLSEYLPNDDITIRQVKVITDSSIPNHSLIACYLDKKTGFAGVKQGDRVRSALNETNKTITLGGFDLRKEDTLRLYWEYAVEESNNASVETTRDLLVYIEFDNLEEIEKLKFDSVTRNLTQSIENTSGSSSTLQSQFSFSSVKVVGTSMYVSVDSDLYVKANRDEVIKSVSGARALTLLNKDMPHQCNNLWTQGLNVPDGATLSNYIRVKHIGGHTKEV